MKQKLNNSQLDRLSEFTANLGLVFFAEMNLDWLKTFYIAGGLLLLAIAILAYPSLQTRSQGTSGQ